MAQEVRIAGATYSDVPSISVPDSNNVYHSFVDTSPTTATDSDVASGKIYFKADGTQSTGTASGGGGGAISVVDTTDTAGGIIRTITAVEISDTTAVASDVAQGKYFYTANGTKTAGTASGGGSEMWFGAGGATLVDTFNYSFKLSDTDYAQKTPTTSYTDLTLPATAYSAAGTHVRVLSYTSGVDLSQNALAVVYDILCEDAYTLDTITTPRQLAVAASGVVFVGQNISYSQGKPVASGFTTSANTVLCNMYVNQSGTTVGTTAAYGIVPSAPSFSGASSGTTLTELYGTLNVSIRGNSSYMAIDNFQYLDTDTEVKMRLKLYQIDYPGVQSGKVNRAVYMIRNSAFPTD